MSNARLGTRCDVRRADGSSAEEVRVLVIVVTYNSSRCIGELVDSLRSALQPIDWRLVIVDNASVDVTATTVADVAPDAAFVQAGNNVGYAAGINLGGKLIGDATAVLVLNPDVKLDRSCVLSLLDALKAPGAGIAVPRIASGEGELVRSVRREPTLGRAWADALLGASLSGRLGGLGEVVMSPRQYERPVTVDWAQGSVMLVSRECWDRASPWDERFFLYSEETDFALRARDAGFTTRFEPGAVAMHAGGESRVSPPLWSLLSVNRVRLYSLRHGVVTTGSFWAALVVRESLRAVLGRKTNRSALAALLRPWTWVDMARPRPN